MLSMSGRRVSFLAAAMLATVPFVARAMAWCGGPAVTIVADAAAACDGDNLVTNGSFECRTAGQPPSHIETLALGMTDLAGWEIIDPSPLPPPSDEAAKRELGDRGPAWTIDWIGPTRWKAAHGSYCLDLDGGIRQAIKTEPGKTYDLRFDIAANPELGVNTAHLRVLIDDDRHDFEFSSAGHDQGNLGWSTKTVQFKATRPETTLTFFNSQPSAQSAGVALDDVVVASGERPKDRFRVTETGGGPILLDTKTGQQWQLTTQDGKDVWLPIPREEKARRQ
jgi:hypothetical protein